MYYYCNICDNTINQKSRNKHNRSKKHYFMKKTCDKCLQL